jgi:hypothetical protein
MLVNESVSTPAASVYTGFPEIRTRPSAPNTSSLDILSDGNVCQLSGTKPRAILKCRNIARIRRDGAVAEQLQLRISVYRR